MMDPDLVNCTEERNDYIQSTKIDRTCGLYKTFHLKALTLTKQNTEILCACGTTYTKKVFTRIKEHFTHTHRSC